MNVFFSYSVNDRYVYFLNCSLVTLIFPSIRRFSITSIVFRRAHDHQSFVGNTERLSPSFFSALDLAGCIVFINSMVNFIKYHSLCANLSPAGLKIFWLVECATTQYHRLQLAVLLKYMCVG